MLNTINARYAASFFNQQNPLLEKALAAASQYNGFSRRAFESVVSRKPLQLMLLPLYESGSRKLLVARFELSGADQTMRFATDQVDKHPCQFPGQRC